MHIIALVAQFPVSFSIQQNLETIKEILNQARPGDLVVLPEGSVSGYSDDLAFLEKIDHLELEAGLDSLRTEARKREIHLWVGACLRKDGNWFNAGIGYGHGPAGEAYIYHKVNLATHERGTFTPGADLPVFQLRMPNGVVTIGVQLCRDVRFPEQWGWLARHGAQIILHLNNAVGNALDQSVWRSHLISRAVEVQRFVISANNAAPEQKCPTIVVAPDGQVVGEIVSEQSGTLRVGLDLSRVSDWYISQCRTDLVAIKPVNTSDFPGGIL